MNGSKGSLRHLLAAIALAALLAPVPLIAKEGERAKKPEEPAAKQESERPNPEAKMREAFRHRRELEEKAAQLKQKLESLRPDQEADAKELRAKLKAIEEQLRAMPVPPGARVPEQIQRRAGELKEAHRRAKEAGNREEAERIERELRELMQSVGRRPGGPPQDREEAERRLQHLRAAIENLHAAGLHEQAEALARETERFRNPGRERGERRPERPSRFGPAEGASAEQLQRAVEELRGQVRQLHRQMEEIREAFQRITREKRSEK